MSLLNKKVTIIIPNYNHARYLPARINSVLNQTYKNFEILLLDDCSTDNSREIISTYKNDSRVKVIFNEQNSGSTFKQWNKGFSLAQGEYIWIAESDDVADITFLEKLVAILDVNVDVGLAYCQSWRMDENDQLHGTWEPVTAELDSELWKNDFILPGHELVRRFMIHSNIIPNASAVVMRRTTLEELGTADESMRIAGDWVFWVRFMMKSKLAFIAEPLNYFRFHEHNVRNRTRYDGTELLEIAKAMYFVKSQQQPEPVVYYKAITQIIERWFTALIYYPMPIVRHRQFLKLMNKVEPNFKIKVFNNFMHILIRNKFSGLKMLIGDKILGLHKRKVLS